MATNKAGEVNQDKLNIASSAIQDWLDARPPSRREAQGAALIHHASLEQAQREAATAERFNQSRSAAAERAKIEKLREQVPAAFNPAALRAWYQEGVATMPPHIAAIAAMAARYRRLVSAPSLSLEEQTERDALATATTRAGQAEREVRLSRVVLTSDECSPASLVAAVRQSRDGARALAAIEGAIPSKFRGEVSDLATQMLAEAGDLEDKLARFQWHELEGLARSMA